MVCRRTKHFAVKKALWVKEETTKVSTNEAEDVDWSLIEACEGLLAEKLKAGMDKELGSLRKFDVFIGTTLKAMGERGTIIPTRWVLRRKGSGCKAHSIAKGFVQKGLDPDLTYASTPALSTA